MGEAALDSWIQRAEPRPATPASQTAAIAIDGHDLLQLVEQPGAIPGAQPQGLGQLGAGFERDDVVPDLTAALGAQRLQTRFER